MATIIRAGLPLPSGRLVQLARNANIPVLFSANAFMVRGADGRISRVRKPSRSQFFGFDAALDSAGFVAAAKYRGYPWSIDEYLNLVESYEWAWYSTMDYCVEPELAGSKMEVMFRIAETCRLYSEVRKVAADRGLPLPMPVLQGWTPAQYLWCADHYPLWEWPELIGIGSMCRRNVRGEVGVLAVIDALDRIMPPHTKFHLFGVKGKALELIGNHPRIHSIDSMAWDFAARRDHPIGRTAELRAQYMFDWVAKNSYAVSNAANPHTLPLFGTEQEQVSDELGEWLELVASGEIEGAAAHWHAMSEGVSG